MAVCGGFVCSKNALTALNSLYIIVAIILIAVGAYAKGASIVTSLPVVAGIIAAGVFLLFVAILGLYGSAKHHQVILFFYMIILFLIFLIQFFVAVACLAINQEQLTTLINKSWNNTSDDIKKAAQAHFQCYGISNDAGKQIAGPGDPMEFCNSTNCASCSDSIPKGSHEALQVAGAVGLFFSFTEILGIGLAMRFRNQKNPKANPDMFL